VLAKELAKIHSTLEVLAPLAAIERRRDLSPGTKRASEFHLSSCTIRRMALSTGAKKSYGHPSGLLEGHVETAGVQRLMVGVSVSIITPTSYITRLGLCPWHLLLPRLSHQTQDEAHMPITARSGISFLTPFSIDSFHSL